jgi:hypothetical protein
MLINTAVLTLIIRNKIKEVPALGFIYIPSIFADALLTAVFLDILNKYTLS